MEKAIVKMNAMWEAEHMKELSCEILGLIWKINPIYLAYNHISFSLLLGSLKRYVIKIYL